MKDDQIQGTSWASYYILQDPEKLIHVFVSRRAA